MERFRLLLVMLSILTTCHSFNIDTNNLVIQQSPRGSCDDNCMFGFSVAQHREGGVPWLLVGAPEADARQPGVHRGGAVYKCSVDRQGDCQIIPFDKSGTTTARNGQETDNKSGQWLGSLVTSSGEDGTILACAPRYVWYSRNLMRREPIGTCYTAKNNFAEVFEYSPCKTRKWGYHRQGSCQAGLGAAIDKTGDQLFIGAVGSWYWQGQAFSFNTKQLRNQISTEEGSPNDDDSYLGYSVATGEFTGDGVLDVAVGMPRGANLTGKVVLYNNNLTNLHNLTGDQIGAYFGYSIATCDINGDGLDDILIGAPMWTDFTAMGKFETGRVYVVYQDKNHRFRQWDTLNGENHKARFGLSVTSLGNINLDGEKGGYQDFAVGAPYDGPNHQGAVYVYLGSKEGVMKKPSQVIYASSFNRQIRTFGWSLSGGMDLDNNNYPDLLVGAYDSGHAVHMRAAPVAHMTASINFDVSSKQIDLENLQCTLRDRTRVPCVQVSISLKYTGVGVPDRMDFTLEYNLDSKKENQKRMFLHQQEGQTSLSRTISMSKDREFKDRFKVYLLGSKIYDKLTSLDIQMKYSLASSSGSGRTPSGLTPVLAHGDHLVTDSLNIQKECGSDSICIPNLSIKTQKIESYLMGSGERLEIQTEITNYGEDAFNALLEVQLPMGVSYINANTTDPSVNILCSPPSPMNNNTVQCEVGNPLKANKQVTARVYVMPSSDGFVDIPVSEFSFLVNARSSNPEEGGEGDNFEEFTVPIRVETDFRVTGKSDPLEVEYNISAPLPSKYEYEDEIGEEVRHIYDVKNKGPTSISEAEVYILWPSYNEYEDHLLYLLDFTASDKAYCEPYKNKNPLMVKVQGTRAYEEFMAEQQIQYQSSSTSQSSQSSSSDRYSGSSSYSSSSSSYSSSSSRSQSSNEGFGGRMTSFSDSDDDRMVNVNVVTGAARGPGDYHGTMTKAELEREAGGRVFGVSNTQVENTRYGGQARYQGAVVADGAEETRLFDTQGQLIVKKSESEAPTEPPVFLTQSGSSSSSSNNKKDEEVVYSGWRLLDNGTYIRVYDNQKSGSGSQGYSSSSGSSSSSSYSSSSSSSGYGHGLKSSSEQITLDNKEESSTSGGDDNSGYMNTGWVQQPDGTYIRKQSSWSSSSSSRGSGGSSYGSGSSGASFGSGSEYSAGSSGSSNRGYSSSSAGSGGYSSSNSVFGAAQGPGDYHGTMSKAELEREAGGRIFSGSSSQETRQQVENTQYRGGAAGAGQSGYSDDNDVVVTKGGRWVWSETNNKWEWEEAGGGGSRLSDSGSDDSGWVQLSNGTWTRRQSSWSSSSSSQSGVRYGGGSGQGGVATGAMVTGQQGGDWGDQGNNSTGWVTMPDGTMVKKSSSWASWSSSSYDDVPGGNALDHVQRQLEHRVRNNLDRQLPSNVEPGFESEYQRNRRHKRQATRPKRSLAEFQAELDSCGAKTCTIIKCTIGPLKEDESVQFAVRSRLFTETQVKNYAEKVKISSKLVTRVTKLPFLVDEKHLAFQTHVVTTTVIPSEPGEAGIPWWVWILAVLGGILVLAFITYCLYKCGFFKRQRHGDHGPESEPLNGNANGY